MEFNREQIIKTLECLHQRILSTRLAEKITEAEMMAIIDALALIKELIEKVENYRNELGEVRVALAEANNDKKKLLEEIESLEKTNEYYFELEQGCYVTGVKNVTADTVRKMQSLIKERCIKGGIYPAFVANVIDQIAKEMLEG